MLEVNEDPWEILGVSRDAGPKEMKKAFRTAAVKYHPDKQKTEEDKEAAHDIFTKLSTAYEIASDPVKSSRWKLAEDARMKQRQVVTHNQEVSTSSPNKDGKVTPEVVVPVPQSAPNRSSHGTSHSDTGKKMPSGSGHHNTGTPHGTRHSSTPNKMHGNSHHKTGGPLPKTGDSTHRSTHGKDVAHHEPHSQHRQTSRQVDHHGHAPPEQPLTRTSAHKTGNVSQSHHPKSAANPGNPQSSKQWFKPQQHQVKPKVIYYRDPFEIFDKVMKEEFGDDYKEKEASGWKKSMGVPGLAAINPFKKKNENSHKEFKKLDVDGDATLTKTELAHYIETHSELWTTLGKLLDLPVYKCIEIATNVAFVLALKQGDTMTLSFERDMTEAEFKYFHQNYILSPKGAQEYFLRTIFAAFDLNKDGVLSARELDRFLDIFYKARDVFKGDMKLPDRSSLSQIVRERCDKNKDNKLQFAEIRDLLQVAAVVNADKVD